MKFLETLTGIVNQASPDLRRRLLGICTLLIVFNGGIWILTIVASFTYPILLGLTTIAYGLGLRHAVDADHIAAIDNTTRKLMQDGQQPVGVGLFFSLGHSTIVILLSLLVAISAVFVKENLPSFQDTGSFIGMSISSIFLLVIGLINLLTLIELFKTWKFVMKKKRYTNALNHALYGKGIMTRILRPLLKIINRSWKMYIVGFLFGLGFDTATEVGLLSIAATSAASGMPIWYIMILPLAFTAGMTLIDSLNGILMLGAYGWAYTKPIRKLYYNMNITLISVLIALTIGGITAMQLLIERLQLSGGLFDVIESVEFEYVGYITIVLFVASWILSIAFYKYKKFDSKI